LFNLVKQTFMNVILFDALNINGTRFFNKQFEKLAEELDIMAGIIKNAKDESEMPKNIEKVDKGLMESP
jgi:hypothetical protein